MFYVQYYSHNYGMQFARKYDTRIRELNELVHEFLRTKHLTGRLEYEFQLGNVEEPTGWATLTVDTADPRLHEELNSFISNLERINAADPHGIDALLSRH
jgi:hypothetical protein